MKLIVCLDDRNGMQFNRRRQSRDEAVCEQIMALSQGSFLRMNDYSANLFPNENVRVSEDFMSQAQPGDYCFVENTDVLSYMEQVEEVFVFRWNRVYPADMHFPEQLLKGKKTTFAEFPGKSHPKITLEVYSR